MRPKCVIKAEISFNVTEEFLHDPHRTQDDAMDLVKRVFSRLTREVLEDNIRSGFENDNMNVKVVTDILNQNEER